MSDLEKAVDSIRRRTWDNMRSQWLNYIPFFPDPGTPPESGVAEVPGLVGIASDLAAERKDAEEIYRGAIEKERCRLLHPANSKGLNKEVAVQAASRFEMQKAREMHNKLLPRNIEVPALRETIFRESVFLLHKALHVLGVAEMSVEIGVRTWALCDAYQSALFAAKALLGMCGVAIAEVDSRTLIIDLFSDVGARNAMEGAPGIRFVKGVLDHKAIWQLLQRVLRVTVCASWPSDAVGNLQIGDVKRFARQRNEIHYRNIVWPLPDMVQFLTEGSFGEILHWESGDEDFAVERTDISLVLGYYLVRMTLALLGDLEELSAKLTPEMEIFRSCICGERHPLYFGSLYEEIDVPG